MNNIELTHKTKQRGITSIEVAFGVVILGVVLVFAMYAISNFVNTTRDTTEKTQALYLAEEGLECVRFMRDESWTSLSSLPLNTTKYLTLQSGTVVATSTPEILNGFTRSFTIQNVYRDSSTNDIVASTTSGSVADTSSKYITMTVTWGSPMKTISLTTILADLTP